MKASGTPVCWGSDEYRQVSGIPSDIGTVSSISAGAYHSCAVKTNGTPVCWGWDSYRQVSGMPSDIGMVSSISAGTYHTCAVRVNVAPVCWGADSQQQVSGMPSDIGTVSSISAGAYHSCAVKTNGTPVCWGWDSYRQVSGMPSDIGTVSAISAGAGSATSCAVKTDRTPVCWGDDEDQQVSGMPSDIGTVSAITTANRHSCAVKTNGTLVCWGADSYDQLSGIPWDLGTVGPLPPAMTTRPSVRAPAWAAGETVTADRGAWSNDPTGYDIAWYRCRTDNACWVIPGTDAEGDDTTYTLTGADNGYRIMVRVTAQNAAGETKRFSRPSPAVGVPVLQTPPSVSGNPRTGQQLTVDVGAWTRSPSSHEVQWLRCTSLWLAGCTKITSEDADDNDTTYTLDDPDDANRIRARVIAKNTAGPSIPSITQPTVLIDKPTPIGRPALATTTAITGTSLSTGYGNWTGNPTSYSVEWLRCSTLYLNSCTTITNADATDRDTSYTPTANDIGKRIRSRIHARNAAGSNHKASGYSKKVVAPPAT
ncbi:MAG: hypothetical protein AVDCRST_MAG64-3613 [uncultured Phycisphaerae bacterium]|uniref:non-specific serine/threonine protein kinase n=1 Tax=uncultured Phycisphaerae bacterium TaxID=904963 RepID=A0A6J4QAU6_9BACT|nr:MAG: hypothetical protein AVDCRST_MAG64-3613 [uncultured Phycisphaerae bacterium]